MLLVSPSDWVDFGLSEVPFDEVPYSEAASGFDRKAAAAVYECVIYTDGAGASKWVASSLGRVGAGGVALGGVGGLLHRGAWPSNGTSRGVVGGNGGLTRRSPAQRKKVKVVTDASYVAGGAAKWGAGRLSLTATCGTLF